MSFCFTINLESVDRFFPFVLSGKGDMFHPLFSAGVGSDLLRIKENILNATQAT